MAADTSATTTLTCPHCRESFESELLDGDAGRLRGFKCPHCRLFVPEDRTEDAALDRDDER